MDTILLFKGEETINRQAGLSYGDGNRETAVLQLKKRLLGDETLAGKRHKHVVSCRVSIILSPLHSLTVSIMIQGLISLPTVPDNLCLISHTVFHTLCNYRVYFL